MTDELFHPTGDGAVVLRVHVLPGAGRTAVIGRHGDAVKVRVAAPPQGGRANRAAAELLAESFGVAGSAVELVSGSSSRIKRFRLSGLEVDEVRRRLARVLNGADRRAGNRDGRWVGDG